MSEVKPGQIWQDNDPRERNRFVRVYRVEGDYAFCQRVMPKDAPGVYTVVPGSRVTRIALRRMKPTKTGYRLLPTPA